MSQIDDFLDGKTAPPQQKSEIDAFLDGAPAPKRTWGQAIKDTGAQLAEGVNTTLGAIPSFVAPQSKAAGFFRDNAEHWRDQQSDVLKGRIAETDKRIAEAGKDGVLSQIGTAASEYWNDPAQAARLAATNLPSMAATLGTGAAAGFAAKGVAAARGLDAANKAALAAKYGTTTAYATNAALNAGGARGEAFEDLQKSALAQGMTPEQAEQAGVSGSILPGVVGAVAGAISGKIGLEKAILGQATKGAAMRKAAGAFGAELAGEQIEELAPKVATNYQVGRIDPGRTLTDDLGRTMVETAIGSGPGAVVAGGAAGMRNEELPPSPGAGDDPTTSPGAADPNAPVPPGAAPVEAPDLQTSLGAGVPRDGMDFTREVDTSGMSLEDPAEVERDRAARMDYQPGDTTPQWDTAPGVAQDRTPGLDMPEPTFDTGNLGLESRSREVAPLSVQMGLDPSIGALTTIAAKAVDSGASAVAQAAQEAQFIGATGRDVQVRRTGPGVTNESNVIDVQGRVIEDRAIETPRRLPSPQSYIERGAQAFSEGVPRAQIASIPNVAERAAALRGYDQAAKAAPVRPAQQPALPAPATNVLERIRQNREAAARMAQPSQPQEQSDVPQAPQAVQAIAQQQEAGGQALAGAAAAPAAGANAAGGSGVQAAGLNNGAPTQNPGTQAAAEAGAQGTAQATPGTDPAVSTMRGLAQQFRDRHATTKKDTDRTFAEVLDQFAQDVEQGKRTPQSVQQAIERYQELAAEPVQAAPAAIHADPGQTPEVVTPAVVSQSVQKAARNEDTKPSEMRKWLIGKIDEAIAVAPEAAVDFLSFDVPGDGTFKVQNSRARLQEFRKKVMASPGFKDGGQKQAKPQQNESILNSGGTAETIRAFLVDGDVQGAVEFAKLKGVEFTPVPPQMKMSADGKGKVKRMPASVKSSVPSVAEGLTQVEAEQINQYLTAEKAEAEDAIALEQEAKRDPATASMAKEKTEFPGTDWKGRAWSGQRFMSDEARDSEMRPGYIGSTKNNAPYENRAGALGRLRADDYKLTDTYEIVQVGESGFAVRPIDGSYPEYAQTPAKPDNSVKPQPITRADVTAAQQQAAEDNYLDTLFGGGSESASAAQAAPSKRRIDAKKIVPALRQLADQKQAEADDWAGRVYRNNTTQIDLRGDGPSRQDSMSTNSVNESRRRRAVEALTQQANAASKLADRVENGAIDLQARLDSISDTVDSDMRRDGGKPMIGSSRADMFEGYISNNLLGDDNYGHGQGTVARMLREAYEGQEQPAAQPITRADVTAAQQKAADLIGAAIDAMPAGEVNRIAKKFLPTMGVKPTVSKERNKAAVTDFTKVNQMAAAAEFGVKLPADVRRALDADMQGKVADAGQDDGVNPRVPRENRAPAKLIEQGEQKEPWQMTAMEFGQQERGNPHWNQSYAGKDDGAYLADVQKTHLRLVQDAVDAGLMADPEVLAAAKQSLADAKQEQDKQQPAWHTTIPDSGVQVIAGDEKMDGSTRVLHRIAAEAAQAVTQAQGLANVRLYAYYLPSTAQEHGAVRLFPDDQTPPKPWSLLMPEGLPVGMLSKDALSARIRDALRSAPVLTSGGEKKILAAQAQGPVRRPAAAKQEADEQQARADNRKKVKQGAADNPFADYNALAQQYGYEVRPDGAIGSDGKFPGPTMKVKGGRLRIESGSGDLLASYAGTSPDSLGKFLESFWYAEKKADGFVEQGATAPKSTAKPAASRFDAGKTLTKEQRRKVLATLTDVYQTKGAPREMKGVGQDGNERYGYVYSPELFEKSDITGAMVRHYVTLPDGRIAHPTELFPEMSMADVERRAQEAAEDAQRSSAYEKAIKPFFSDFDSANLFASVGQVVIGKDDRFAVIANKFGAVSQARQYGWEVVRQASQQEQVAEKAEAKQTITDFGEKIGGARKDTATKGAQATRSRSDDDGPAWARRFEISQIAKSSKPSEAGRWVVRDTRAKDWTGQPKQMGEKTFATLEEARAAIPLIAVSQKHRVYQDRDGKHAIWRTISDAKRVRVVEQSFDSYEDAMRYMAQNAQAIIETNTTFGEADLPRPASATRIGEQRRTSDAKDSDFQEVFGFRGVEFGNWNNQAERQELLNDAYDGLLDLAQVMGIPPKAISLDGELALAFGARGHGLSGARAHYERDKVVINLTKMNGAGSLAHEWFHAVDHYFARQDGKASAEWVVDKDGTRSLKASSAAGSDYVSSGTRGERSGMRAELRQALAQVMLTIAKKAETYVQDTQQADAFVGRARKDVHDALGKLRASLAQSLDYKKRNNQPASAEQLAQFDAIAERIVAGELLDTSLQPVDGARSVMSGLRWTNDALNQISAILKAVRGRNGFDASGKGELDNLRGYMSRYSQRMKMLADAQAGAEKQRAVPTEFVMNAKELDQGRGQDYWTQPHELAARAFQGYVEDKLAEQGGKSPFLNYAPEGAGILTPWGVKRPFPTGAERKAINSAFDNLVSTIQTKDTDKGVAMFSRTGAGGAQSGNAKQATAPRTWYDRFVSLLPESYRNDPHRREPLPAEDWNVQRSSEVRAKVEALNKQLRGENDRKGYGPISVDGLGNLQVDARDVSAADLSGSIKALADALDAGIAVTGVKLGDAQALRAAGFVSEPSLAAIADRLMNRPFAAPDNVYAKDAAPGTIMAYKPRGFPAALFSRQPPADSAERNAATELLVDGLIANWKKAPPIIVARNMQDTQVPQEVRDYDALLKSQGATGEPRGFIYQGTVYLLSDQLKGPRQIAEVLFHEALGHYGLRGVFGKGLDNILRQIGTMRRKEVVAKAREYGLFDKDALGGADKDAVSDREIWAAMSEQDRLSAAEEVLAEMAQTRPDLGFVQRAIAAIRNWLRANVPGFDGMKLSDADIVQAYIIPARGFVTRSNETVKESIDRAMRDVMGVNFSRADSGAAADQTQTEAFKRWFKDSKVVDADGKPLVVYHGTTSEFNTFRVGNAPGWGRGIYFTNNESVARDEYAGDDGRVVAAYVSLQNPYTGQHITEAQMEATEAGKKVLADGGNVIDASNDDGRFFGSMLRELGYDGVMLKGSNNIDGYEIVAFRPEQIKSATDNNGNFDPTNPDIRFSRATAAGVAERMGDAVKSVTVQSIKDAASYKKADWLGLGLQALGRRQITEIYGKDLPQLNTYNKLAAQMEADKNESGAEADKLADRWGKLKDEKALAELMHDATLAQIDPEKAYVPGDDKLKYQVLSTRFKNLSDEAKALYRDARQAYKDHHGKVRDAIRERIERSDLGGERKAALLARMDDEFFQAVKGVYFPLARFGEYVVAVRGPDGKIASVNRAETMKEAQALRASLLAAFPASSGHTVLRPTLSKAFIASRDMVGRGFMSELYEVLDKQDMDAAARAELEDTLGQLYLSSLPDLSWAKHGIHRKGTPGFSQDARRAFAQNMFHGARYLAKMRYADLLTQQLQDAQKMVDAWSEVEDFDQPTMQRVVDEMNKRHESMMNPQSNPLSTALTSFGFIFHLGLSPASAMVNLTQTALVAYPVMAAKWGYDKAGAALLRASKEAASNRNDISKVLQGDERRAYEEAVRAGTIDVTMAHDLAGIAQGEDSGVLWKLRPVMKWASFMFHHAERFNRQATFIAAYRLARESGAKHEAAVEQATDATYQGHFDYSATNRPRIMQGNVAKVLLLFKQYGQNMVYTLARSAQQSIKGKKPEERREARRALGGLLAMHGLAAGALGLPLVNVLLAAASMLGSDDDEPWDAKVALQNMLADALGQKPTEVLMHGVSRLTPWDISGRVGLDKLILPDIQEGLEGQRLAESAMAAALGPVAGIGVKALKGAQLMGDGHWLRGLEAMMPAALRGPVKALRYGSEGAQDKTGIAILDDVSPAAVAGQAMGFSPSAVRNATEGKSAILSLDRQLNERRKSLTAQFAMAQMAGDREGVQEAREAIAKFNEKNPTRRITVLQLMQSVRNRQKRIDQAQDGVYLPKNRRDAMAAGRFAEV